jgi:FkbM family methyltransferase
MVFRTKSFRVEPVSTACRAAGWVFFHVLPRREGTIRVRVGRTSFRLRVAPLPRKFGSMGIFVQQGLYEPLLEFADRFVVQGDVVFDCGASQGIYSCAFGALVGASGRVYSFEPQAHGVDVVRGNARLNEFSHIHVEQAAVFDRDGEAVLDTTKGAVAASIVRDLGQLSTVRVPTITLTTFAKRVGLERLDFIKMDVEGAEYAALRGAEPLIAKYKPKIAIEADIGRGDWTEIVEFLNRHGYRWYVFDEQGNLVCNHTISGYHANVLFLPS